MKRLCCLMLLFISLIGCSIGDQNPTDTESPSSYKNNPKLTDFLEKQGLAVGVPLEDVLDSPVYNFTLTSENIRVEGNPNDFVSHTKFVHEVMEMANINAGSKKFAGHKDRSIYLYNRDCSPDVTKEGFCMAAFDKQLNSAELVKCIAFSSETLTNDMQMKLIGEFHNKYGDSGAILYGEQFTGNIQDKPSYLNKYTSECGYLLLLRGRFVKIIVKCGYNAVTCHVTDMQLKEKLTADQEKLSNQGHTVDNLKKAF